MSDKFNIDDSILLDPDAARSSNIKKILTGIAILVVLFLIIIMVMKFINSGDSTESTPLVMPSEESILSPKTETKPIVEVKPVETKPIEIKPVEIKPATEPKAEVSVKDVTTTSDLIKKEESKPDTTPKVIEQPKVEPIETKQVVKEEPKTGVVVVTADKNAPQPTLKKEEPKKSEPVKASEPTKSPEPAKKTQEPKAEPKKAEPKTEPAKVEPKKPTPIKKGVEITGNVPSGSYIQVLATSEFKPSNAYISKLTSAGYSYRLYKENVNGTEFTKVLVGPYNGAELQNNMSNIRATINKDAFVFRVK